MDDQPPERPAREKPRGGDGKFTRSTETAERDAEAARLRSRGLPYRAIGEALGMNVANAHAAVQRALKAIVAEPAAEVRVLELERLDRMYEAVLGVLEREHVTVSGGKVVQVVDKDSGEESPLLDDSPILQAVDRLLKIQERRAKLLGIDAEKKINLSGGVTYELIGIDQETL